MFTDDAGFNPYGCTYTVDVILITGEILLPKQPINLFLFCKNGSFQTRFSFNLLLSYVYP